MLKVLIFFLVLVLVYYPIYKFIQIIFKLYRFETEDKRLEENYLESKEKLSKGIEEEINEIKEKQEKIKRMKGELK